MKTMKKSLAVFMALLMLMSGFVLGASAIEPETKVIEVAIAVNEEHNSATASITPKEGVTYTNVNYSISPSDKVGYDNENMPGFFYNLTPGVKYTVSATATVAEGMDISAGVGENSFAIKKTIEIPEAITITDLTDTSVSIEKIAEENDVYCIAVKESDVADNWVTKTTFEGLEKGKTYTVKAKIKGDDLINESEILSTNITTGVITDAMVVKATFDKSKMAADITYTQIPGYTYGNVKYSVDPSEGVTINNAHITGLVTDKTYTFTVEALVNTGASFVKMSGSDTVKVKKSQKAPSALTESNITATSITLKAIANAEYSVDGVTYQDSNVFEELTPDSWYTFYARNKETDTEYASEAVESNKLRTNIAADTVVPEKPIIADITNNSLTLKKTENYEYSIDGGKTWSSSEQFKGLTASTQYKVVQRKKAIERQDTNPSSEIVVIQTNSRAPIVANPANCKFSVTSRNGVAYQNDPVTLSISDVTGTTSAPAWGDTNLVPALIKYKCGTDEGTATVTNNAATFTPATKGTYTITVVFKEMKYRDVTNGDGTVTYKYVYSGAVEKTYTVTVGSEYNQIKIALQKLLSFLLTTVPNALSKMGGFVDVIKKMFQGAI